MNQLITAALTLFLAAATSFAISPAENYVDKPADWYKTDEAKTIAANILAWQFPDGGWPKNTDTLTPPPASRPRTGDGAHSTFDNGATTYELRYLAKVFAATGADKYRAAFDKGLDLILKAQYDNGGWPQYYPPGRDYSRNITFNDGSMERLVRLTRDVARDDLYAFVPKEKRDACAAAWTKGIDTILKTQIKVDDKPTIWCAQHDEKTFAPTNARAFEPASYSGAESVGLVELLMLVENPSSEIVTAVDSAVAFFEKLALDNIRVEDRKVAGTPRGFDRSVVVDFHAPPMWARFYDFKTLKPLFIDRDAVPRPHLSDLGIERRTGYKWLGDWPKELIEKRYPEWKAKVGR